MEDLLSDRSTCQSVSRIRCPGTSQFHETSHLISGKTLGSDGCPKHNYMIHQWKRATSFSADHSSGQKSPQL